MRSDITLLNGLIDKLPKAELHVHLEGCLEPELVLEFADRNGLDLGYENSDELRKANRFTNLLEFLDVMQRNSATICTARDVYDLASFYLRRAHENNIVHAEMACSPQGPALRGVPYEAVLDGIVAAFRDARSNLGITGGPILACLRHRPPEEGLAMIERYGRKYRDDIIAIGLHGAERGNPPSLYERSFSLAREYGWKAVAHAGEDGPPDYIRQAIDILRVDRIDHGVLCESDRDLVTELRDRNIGLTVCPMSNVALGLFASVDRHNLRRLLRKGLNVSLHTDDPAYFGGYLNSHYKTVIERQHLSVHDLKQLQINSFASACMPEDMRAKYIAKNINLLNDVSKGGRCK